MKPRHNKKRNTLFLFEALVRNLTQAVVKQDEKRSRVIKKILREHFGNNTLLGKEMECYEAIIKSSNLDKYTAEKMVFHAKRQHQALGNKKVFHSQSVLIKRINETLGADIYKTFVPNYKSLATISQLFGDGLTVKDRVLLENKIIEKMMRAPDTIENLKPQDDLVITSFQKRFNEKYASLLPEQKEVLKHYVLSFGDEEANFKVFMAQTLQRIQEEIQNSLDYSEVAEDVQMVENTQQVLKRLEFYDVNDLTTKDILKAIKMQQLVKEYHSDAT